MSEIKIDLQNIAGKIQFRSKTKFKINVATPVSSSEEATKQAVAEPATTEIGKKPKIKIVVAQVVKKEQPELRFQQLPEPQFIRSQPQLHCQQKPQYVISHGFMLANNFYESSTVPRINPTGWWQSEKFDGVRAIWDGCDFYTRNLTKIAAPQWFKDMMPTNIALDGEFFIKRGHFNTTSGIIRKLSAIDIEWRPMKYMIFDVPSSQEPFESRLEIIKGVVQSTGFPLVCVEQIKVTSLDDMLERHKSLVSRGAEGSMLRQPGSRYVAGRSESILKVKDQAEEDAYIISWDEGEGKNKGKLGALWIKWVDPQSIREKYGLSVTPYVDFRVGSGFKDIDRCQISEAPKRYPKGDIVKVGFFGLQDSGKPRHPAFKGIRE